MVVERVVGQEDVDRRGVPPQPGLRIPGEPEALLVGHLDLGGQGGHEDVEPLGSEILLDVRVEGVSDTAAEVFSKQIEESLGIAGLKVAPRARLRELADARCLQPAHADPAALFAQLYAWYRAGYLSSSGARPTH